MIIKKHPYLTILLIALVAAWFSSRSFFVIDTTSHGRNSLADTTVNFLKTIKEPIIVKAFITDLVDKKTVNNFPPANEQRKKVKNFISRFQRVKANLHLEIIDHKKDIDVATKYGVLGPQAVIVEYQGRQKKLKLLDEYSLTHTILQLQQKQNTWIVFTEGNGERSPYSKGKKSLSRIAAWLRLRNSRVQALDLNKHDTIPKNTSILVIASPRAALKPKALSTVIRYIQNQEAHHAKKDFRSEFLDILNKHGIKYDKKYT